MLLVGVVRCFLWCDGAITKDFYSSLSSSISFGINTALSSSFLSDHVSITPKDPQWVGAWWLGYLIAGVISLLAAVPFWCLPKSLPRPRSREGSSSSSEKSKFIIDDHTNFQVHQGEKPKLIEMARGESASLWLWSTFFYSVETLGIQD